MKSLMSSVLVFAAAFSAVAGGLPGRGAVDAPFEMPPIPVAKFADRDFSIADFGAREGVKATDAFAAAMAECEKAGGGRVVVPKGKWLTGAVHLRSNCNLHLAEGATLEFTDDPADYLPAVPSSWEGLECLNYSPLVYAYGCTNVAITGKGILAPRMGRWAAQMERELKTWTSTDKDPRYDIQAARGILYKWGSEGYPVETRDITKAHPAVMRPQLVQFNRCKDVLVEDVRIRDCPFWTIHLFLSENVIVRGVDSRARGFNNDGIDIEMTRNVLVENCRFDQGDDGIVLKAGRNQDAWRLNRPTENVVVRNCELLNSHSLLGIGSELSGGIRNVWMHHCKIGSTYNLFYVKTNRRRGGFVKNVWFEDIESDNLRGGLFRIETDVLYQWANFPDYELRRTEIDGLHVRNVRANCADYAIDVRGDAAAPIRNVELEDVWLGAFRKSFERIENAEVRKRNVRLGDLKPKPWVQPVD
jgi:polygalacturonase